jgi:predicted secreted hydrolase
MLYRMRHKDGSVDPYSSGTYVDAEGKATHLTVRDFSMRPLGETWTSPASGAKYPVAWEVTIPRYGIELQAGTGLKSQELTGRTKYSLSYWEGAVRVRAQREGHEFSGMGYLEMTGYDHPLGQGEGAR